MKSVAFIENVGQFDRNVRFVARGTQFTLTVGERAFWLTVFERSRAERSLDQKSRPDGPRGASVVKMRFSEPASDVSIKGTRRHPTRFSYIRGSDPSRWYPNVPAWQVLRYDGLVAAGGLVLSGETGELTWRISGRRGSKKLPSLRLEGANSVALCNRGGEPVEGSTASHFRIGTPSGDVLFPLPGSAGKLSPPEVRRRGAVGFEISSPFAARREEVTEEAPVTALATEEYAPQLALYTSHPSTDCYLDVALDRHGDAYLVGVEDPSYPASSPTQDVFVARIDRSGSTVYRTVLAGANYDYGAAIAVDNEGEAHVTGTTWSSDFPTTPDALQPALAGFCDAFVTRLDATGALKYSTYLGGPQGGQIGRGIAVDNNRLAYVVGNTSSGKFPTTPDAFQRTLGGPDDVFVSVLAPWRAPLHYSTYLGGSSSDYGWGIALAEDQIYVTGTTSSSDFPTTPGGFQTTFTATRGRSWFDPPETAFVTVLRPGAPALVYSTFLGGDGYDDGLAIAVDPEGYAYVAGAAGPDFPVTSHNAFQPTFGGGSPAQDAFLAMVDPRLSGRSSLIYCSYVGGSSSEAAYGLVVNPSNNVYITGYTFSPDFPVSSRAFQARSTGAPAAFVAAFDLSRSGAASQTFCSYFGGTGAEFGFGIAVDLAGLVCVAGSTTSIDLPFTSNFYGGGLMDGWLLWLQPVP